ncbi:MAG TPA: M36 family metallopeptidase [Thermoanaerobaculia bacterium]|nr:M36 family metallopeptidase [Thermoanaerobaculia bacterium]
MNSKIVAGGVLAFAVTVSLAARELPPIDEFAQGRPHADAGAAVSEKARGLARAGQVIPVEARLRVPTFVWAEAASPTAQPPRRDPSAPRGRREEEAARAHLDRFRNLYELNPGDVASAAVQSIHDTGKGPVIVKLRQHVNGIEIFREEMNVILDRGLELVGISGYLSSASTPGARGKAMSFDVDERTGALHALRDLIPTSLAATDLAESGARGGYSFFTPPPSAVQLEEPLRLKKVYFHTQDGLTPGYYVEVIARDPVTHDIEAYAYVISAADGHILFRNSLVSNAGTPYTYRVWAAADGYPSDSPAGNGAIPKVNPVPDGHQPPFVAPLDITVANYPFSRNDPWLPPGATETAGNNVDAYSDIFYPDGYGPAAAPATPATGDFRAQITGANAFQHAYDFTQPHHHVSRQAAITQLFVDINFLHDWFYDAGFDEAAGNAQFDNYGRGGVAGDRMKAEAQDSSGFDNANMFTPADGFSPRMQMYYWSGFSDSARFEVLSPAGAAGRRTFGTASFGPQTFDVEQPVVQPAPLSACSALTNAGDVAGKIVLVDREPTSGADSCSIATKLTHIAAAGAAGIVLVNLSGWPDTLVTLNETMPSFLTPVMTISWNSAQSIKNELALGNTVTARMIRPSAGIVRDSSLDNQIVAHEWGHYLSNRLIGNGTGLTANQARGMGEGWSDFMAVLLEVRPDDTATPSNATWNGIYSSASFALSGGADGGTNQSYYFGTRRAPYSTDTSKNAFTYKHTVAGVALPAGMALRANGLSNAQVHNTGEIWALMLWECYASLLRDTQGGTPRLTFTEAQQRMKEYLVAALKTTPVNPTILEARDALLAAAFVRDRVDYLKFYQAFAKRGAGIGAVAADRFSSTNGPIVESFNAGGDADVVSYAVTDAGGSCDNDGLLDNGETGQLSITLRNTGATPLNGLTGTVTSQTAGVTLPGGGAVTFADMEILETATVTLPVAMAAGVTGIRTIALSFEYTHAGMDTPVQNAVLTARGNVDELPASSATDSVDTGVTPWTATSGTATPGTPWTRFAAGTQTTWRGTDPTKVSDERLESPPMTISAAGSLKVEFDHLHSFDYDYDGGVVEMSRNGGAWTDIGTSAYNGRIYGSSNPLYPRPAFVYLSGGPQHVTLRPTVAAGDVVRVRFRIGSDASVGGSGWEIDNITFTGIVETPFGAFGPDSGCTKATTTRLASSRNPSRLGDALTLTASVVSPGTPTGTVTFFDGGTPLGTVPMVNRAAALSTSALAGGLHSLTARYDGAAGYLQSTSTPLAQGVDGNCINEPPLIGYLTPSGSFPAGTAIDLGVIASRGSFFTYAWYEGNAGDTTNFVGSGQNVAVAPVQTTKYWVRINNGCGSTDSANVTLTVVPPSFLYTMTPCRVYDSRVWYGKLAPNATIIIDPYYMAGCFPTSMARAVAVNVTVVAPAQDGWLTIYPAGGTRPPTSTTNFRKGKTRSNNAIISLSADGDFIVYNGSTTPVDFIIDAFAYFR